MIIYAIFDPARNKFVASNAMYALRDKHFTDDMSRALIFNEYEKMEANDYAVRYNMTIKRFKLIEEE